LCRNQCRTSAEPAPYCAEPVPNRADPGAAEKHLLNTFIYFKKLNTTNRFAFNFFKPACAYLLKKINGQKTQKKKTFVRSWSAVSRKPEGKEDRTLFPGQKFLGYPLGFRQARVAKNPNNLRAALQST
jgi:hypothetical protein